MNSNLAWTHMIEVLTDKALPSSVVANLVVNKIGLVVDTRIIGKKKND
jgi:hypothetical protein